MIGSLMSFFFNYIIILLLYKYNILETNEFISTDIKNNNLNAMSLHLTLI